MLCISLLQSYLRSQRSCKQHRIYQCPFLYLNIALYFKKKKLVKERDYIGSQLVSGLLIQQSFKM